MHTMSTNADGQWLWITCNTCNYAVKYHKPVNDYSEFNAANTRLEAMTHALGARFSKPAIQCS